MSAVCESIPMTAAEPGGSPAETDLEAAIEETERRDLPNAPDMEVFE